MRVDFLKDTQPIGRMYTIRIQLHSYIYEHHRYHHTSIHYLNTSTQHITFIFVDAQLFSYLKIYSR